MLANNYNDIGRGRINEIFKEGWSQVEFIEIVFREWTKLNQVALNKEYSNQTGLKRQDDDIDQFSLWLVDNIYLQVYCEGSDNMIVKEFCIKYFDYEDGNISISYNPKQETSRDILKKAEGVGLEVNDFSVTGASLETVFLSMTSKK